MRGPTSPAFAYTGIHLLEDAAVTNALCAGRRSIGMACFMLIELHLESLQHLHRASTDFAYVSKAMDTQNPYLLGASDVETLIYDPKPFLTDGELPGVRSAAISCLIGMHMGLLARMTTTYSRSPSVPAPLLFA